MELQSAPNKLTRKDFVSPVEIRWCPGCGNYSIINAIQNTFPDLDIPRENFVIISGIGCSSRFPYYMNTYGFHTIHGRAPTIATGVKVANPELSVWVITGDGDGLSIGGNHLFHVMRRNVDMNILLFNNRIYGLTKGQYSPTSLSGHVTKTSPMGSIEEPVNPLCFAIASEASFVARTTDSNPKHMTEIFKAAARQKGTSFVEIFQNCAIFNNKSWETISGRDVRDEQMLFLEHNKPLVFGQALTKGIRLNGLHPEVVTIGENGITMKDILIHNTVNPDPVYAYLLTQLSYPDFPTPIGIFRSVNRPVYEEEIQKQNMIAQDIKGKQNLHKLLLGSDYWEVSENGKTINMPESAFEQKKLFEESKIMKEQISEISKAMDDPLTAALRTPVKMVFEKYGYQRAMHISSDDMISRAITILKTHKIDAILVMQHGQPIGILTERDIIMNVLLHSIDRSGTPVSKIIGESTEVLHPDNTVGDAINILSFAGKYHLPLKIDVNHYGIFTGNQILCFIHESVHLSDNM